MKKRGREYHPGKDKQGTTTSKWGAIMGSRDARGAKGIFFKR